MSNGLLDDNRSPMFTLNQNGPALQLRGWFREPRSGVIKVTQMGGQRLHRHARKAAFSEAGNQRSSRQHEFLALFMYGRLIEVDHAYDRRESWGQYA
jgi:hypothetical protein